MARSPHLVPRPDCSIRLMQDVSVNLIWPTCDALIWPTLDPICYPDEMVSDSRLARPERSPVPREAGNWA